MFCKAFENSLLAFGNNSLIRKIIDIRCAKISSLLIRTYAYGFTLCYVLHTCFIDNFTQGFAIIFLNFVLIFVAITTVDFSREGGGYVVHLSDGDVPFSGYRFRPFFLEQGVKRRQIFWSRLSKHVKRRNFVTMGYHLVKFLCF